MNILKAIGKDEDIFSFEFFGPEDFGTSYDIRFLVENIEKVRGYFTASSFTIEDLDGFIDYLFLRKYDQFDSILPLLKDEHKNDTESAITFIKECFAMFKKAAVYKYIKESGSSIIEDKENSNIHIVEQILCIAASNSSGLENLLESFIIHRLHMIIYNYQSLQRAIEKNETLFNLLFCEDAFEKIKNIGFSDYLDIIRHYYQNKKFVAKLTPLVILIKDYGLATYALINEDTYLNYEHIFVGIQKFLCDIESEFANSFLEKSTELETFKLKYLEKHGHTLSQSIPMQEILAPFKNEKLDWRIRVILLTHSRNKKTKQFQHYYKTIAENYKPSFTDFACATSFPHNEYFSMSRQTTLNFYNQCYLHALSYFLSKENVSQFFGWIYALTKHVCEKHNIEYADAECHADLEILLNLYAAFLNQDSIDDSHPMNKGVCYGITMFTFALLEKLLRNLYKSLNKDKYIKETWFSLGQLLNIKNDTIVNLLGEDLVRCLRFYILRDDDGNVGYNYRNSFAHYSNITSDVFNYSSCVCSFQYLVSILNQLSL